MVSALDEAIGNITDALKEKGMFENTLILFTADVSCELNYVCLKLKTFKTSHSL